MALSNKDEQIDSAATYFYSRWNSEELAVEKADDYRRSPSPCSEGKNTRPWNFWSDDEPNITPKPVLSNQRHAACSGSNVNLRANKEHHREAVTTLSPSRDDDEATLCGNDPMESQDVVRKPNDFSELFEGGTDDLELGKGAAASQGLNASADFSEDSTGESRIDPDPFRYIQKEDFVNDQRSALGNCIGWIDYMDRYYSRKFSLIDHIIPNVLFCSFGWLFNRKQNLLQLPVLALVFSFYPMVVLDQFKSTNDGKDGKLTAKELQSPELDMNATGPLAKLVLFVITYTLISALAMTFALVVPLKAIGGRERPIRISTVNRLCNMRMLEHGKSMPSGDAAAATLLMSLYLFLFGNPWPLLIVVPLVSLGRVYVHCHWIGDTIVGTMLGLACAYLFWSKDFFSTLALPLFRAFFPHQK